jgi:hypothetical protein
MLIYSYSNFTLALTSPSTRKAPVNLRIISLSILYPDPVSQRSLFRLGSNSHLWDGIGSGSGVGLCLVWYKRWFREPSNQPGSPRTEMCAICRTKRTAIVWSLYILIFYLSVTSPFSLLSFTLFLLLLLVPVRLCCLLVWFMIVVSYHPSLVYISALALVVYVFSYRSQSLARTVFPALIARILLSLLLASVCSNNCALLLWNYSAIEWIESLMYPWELYPITSSVARRPLLFTIYQMYLVWCDQIHELA